MITHLIVYVVIVVILTKLNFHNYAFALYLFYSFIIFGPNVAENVAVHIITLQQIFLLFTNINVVKVRDENQHF